MASRAKSILIVEDDGDLRGLFQVTLSLAGFEAYEARSGYEALRMLDSSAPDLLLLDLALPGIDGFAILRETAANAFTCHIPIVIVTGSPADLSDLDVACVLRKPVGPAELVAVVRTTLRNAAPTTGT